MGIPLKFKSMWEIFKEKEKDIDIENYLIKIGQAAKQSQINKANKCLEELINDSSECNGNEVSTFDHEVYLSYNIKQKDYNLKDWDKIHTIVEKMKYHSELRPKELRFIHKVIKKLDKKYWL